MEIIMGPQPAGGFINWLRSLGQWRDVKELGVYLYQENAVTGQRRAKKIVRLHGMLHRQWLEGGSFELKRPAPPAPMRRRNAKVS